MLPTSGQRESRVLFPLLKPRTTCPEEQDVKKLRIVSGRLGGEETCLYEKLMLQREEKE
jgi:hypothetical protein